MKIIGILDDLALFALVADSGGLAEASRRADVSLPTLGRRMTRLERTLTTRLFLRGKAKYALTVDGRSLRERLDSIEEVQRSVLAWVSDGQESPRIRITAGPWTSRYLAENLGQTWHAGLKWVPEFLASNASLDIARREADIGVRNRPPDKAWMAGRKTTSISYAVYGVSRDTNGFIAFLPDRTSTPSATWLQVNHAENIITTVSDARLMLDLALKGMGRIVLPTFIGCGEKKLKQLGRPIEELTHDEWLVCHHDARNDPPIRRALDALAEILKDPNRGQKS